MAEHMVASFLAGFSLLRPGGVYLIEDITFENAAAIRHLLTEHDLAFDRVNVASKVVSAIGRSMGNKTTDQIFCVSRCMRTVM
eukprot:5945229-Prymnesium_polylepis.1